jgi:hypothetical protein
LRNPILSHSWLEYRSYFWWGSEWLLAISISLLVCFATFGGNKIFGGKIAVNGGENALLESSKPIIEGREIQRRRKTKRSIGQGT